MKWLIRFLVFVELAGTIVIPVLIKDREVPVVSTDPLLISLGGIYIFSGMIIFLYFMYHWGMTEFIRKSYKRRWLAVLLIGTITYFIGPYLYYVFVFELKKGVHKSG